MGIKMFGSTLPMSRFSARKSGLYWQLPPPAHPNGNTLDVIPGWALLGYAEHPPFLADWEDGEIKSIGVMFESPEGEDFWWHFIAPK